MKQNFLYKNLNIFLKGKTNLKSELCKTLKINARTFEKIVKEEKGLTIEQSFAIAEYLELDVMQLIGNDPGIKKKKNIRFLVLDIDGVLTDGGMYYTEHGDEIKKFNTKDGLLIRRLARSGMKVAFLSNGVTTKLIKHRAKLLEITHVYVGTAEKLGILENWAKELKIDFSEIAYIGDDLNDLKLFDTVGFTACPNDACFEIKQKAHIILDKKGGDGCVREFIEKYIL